MSDHTRKERDTINRAWQVLMSRAEGRDMGSTAHKLRIALKLERPERSTITDAKALLIEAAIDGRTKDLNAQDLVGYATGCLIALVVGADLELTPEEVRLLSDAKRAHKSAINRMLERIMLERIK